MRTISREVAEALNLAPLLTPQRLHAELLATSASGSRAYLLGALHDGTICRHHPTVRFGQSDPRWLEVLGALCERLGQRWWTYREGADRDFWILETSSRWLTEIDRPVTEEELLAYARGYFDAEGGVPRDPRARFYVQFVQKDRADISELRTMLTSLGIGCGKLHVPSSAKEPGLWRFYVSAGSHEEFVRRVGSWHPRKRSRLASWLQECETRMVR